MKVFHYKDKIDSLPPESKRILPPIHIRLKPTNACNHNCRYCAYKDDNLQLGKDMQQKDSIPRDKMLEILDDIQEMGVKAVTFSGGGEPFCYPYFLETVKKISESNIKFASLTNGSRLYGEVAEIFAAKGTWLRISLDGWDDASYSEYRNIKAGEFTKLMKNIESFSKMNGSCFLGVSLIIDKKNVTHIYDLISRLQDIGVNSVKVSPCIVSNSGAENNAYHKPFFNTAKEQITRAKAKCSGTRFEVSDAYHDLDETFGKDYDWCPYLQILPVIGADLNIYPCQDKAYNLDEGLIGTIKDKSFKEFWFSNKEQFYKINPSKVCNHHCVANAKNKLILEYLNTDRTHLAFV